MKKIIIAALAIGLVGSAAQAQSNQVLSRNAVGYVKVGVKSNSLAMVRNDFESISGGSVTVSNFIGSQVPLNSQVLLWDRSSQQYRGGTRTRSGEWGSFGTNPVRRGESVFVRVPAGIGISNEYTVYIMGEVPDATTAATTSIQNVTALGMYGYPYPVAVALTNIPIVAGAAVNDQLLLWSQTGQTYVGYTRTRSGGWGGATNIILQPGEGFWLRSAITQQWSQAKPYTWP